jgi:hypothetical protein
MREGVAESDARRGGCDQFAGTRVIKHAGLSSHDGDSFYTGGKEKEVESRELKEKQKITQRRGGTQRSAENSRRNSQSQERERKEGQPGVAVPPRNSIR